MVFDFDIIGYCLVIFTLLYSVCSKLNYYNKTQLVIN